MKTKQLFIIAALLFSVLACSQMIKPTQMEVLNQYEPINTLDKAILQAKANAVDSYAPLGFQKSKNSLDEAIKLAQAGENEKAVALSKESLGTIQLAGENAERAKKIMWEVEDIRQKAIKAGAVDVSKEAFSEAEDKFQKTNALIENGKVEKAKENQPELIQIYSNLEKNALDKGIVELAKLAFEQAKTLEAEKYAPKYFNKSKKELDLALGILATDRTRTNQANEHAKLAAKWARNAGQISALAKTFKLRDFSYEDTVVWYWQQLGIINAPFKDEIDFEQPNHVVIETMQKKIVDIQKVSMESQLLVKKQQDYTDQVQEAHRKEVLKLNSNQSEQQRVQAEKERSDREDRQKFVFIQSLFQEKEAQVYRKGDNILISANGFYFPSGKDEIQTTNFVLLNKILSSIHQFPKARLEISGHTDSSGTADNNMKLSERRAQNVADFITNVGQISLDSILVKGYGATKPIAANTTKEGRDQNRRIDVMIINEQLLRDVTLK